MAADDMISSEKLKPFKITFKARQQKKKKEAGSRKMEVLSTKSNTRIGFWNVRTIYDTGTCRLAQVKSEMRRYNLQILGISDSRW